MDLRPGYKQTDVGVVPDHWNVHQIGDIVSEISMGPFGSDIKVSNFRSSGVPVLNGSNVTGVRVSDDFDNYVTPAKAKSLKKAVARRGDIVVTHRGTLGQIAYIGADSLFDRYVVSQSQFRVRFKAEVAIPEWVVLYFHSEPGSRALLEGKGHTGVPAIASPTTTFRKFLLPTPPISEQVAIAAALSDVDALLAAQDALITKKRAIKLGAMQELLSGKRRLPGFNGGWEMKRLGELAEFFKGKGLPKSALSADGAEPCIHYGELFTQYSETIRETISSTKKSSGSFLSCANDVLMPTSDVTPKGLAKASCIVLDDVVLGGDILVIRANPLLINGTFLSHIIRREEEQVLRLVSGTTVFHLYGTDMKKFVFQLPSLEEQVALVEQLDEMDSAISALETQRAKTAQLKQGMMHELLTGRIRLV